VGLLNRFNFEVLHFATVYLYAAATTIAANCLLFKPTAWLRSGKRLEVTGSCDVASSTLFLPQR